jgi:hypothetical protein
MLAASNPDLQSHKPKLLINKLKFTQMEVIIFESTVFEALKQELKGYVKEAVVEVLKEKAENQQSDWISFSEAQKMLPFKSKTSWQKFRDKGIIKFTQFGRKIMYSRESIREFLNKNKIGD